MLMLGVINFRQFNNKSKCDRIKRNFVSFFLISQKWHLTIELHSMTCPTVGLTHVPNYVPIGVQACEFISEKQTLNMQPFSYYPSYNS